MSSKFKINYVSFKTIIKKEILRILRIWTQTLLPSVITISLYFLVFGSLIGSRIGEMSGFNYVQFIVPGLIMMALITNSFSNVASSFFGIRFVKSIEEILVSPTSNWVIILGFVFGGVFRGIIVAFLVTLVSLFFTKLVIYNLFIIILIMILTSILFSIAGFLNGYFAKKFDDVGIIPLFVLTPLTYLGGVFYSIDLLPEFWQNISKLNPILYIINSFRYGFLGVSDINIWVSILFISILIILLFSISLYLMNKGYKLRE